MKWFNKINLYLLLFLFVILTCIIGAIRKPFPDLISDTAVRIIQGVVIVIAIVFYLIQTKRDKNK